MIVESDKCSALKDYMATTDGANMFVRLHNCLTVVTCLVCLR